MSEKNKNMVDDEIIAAFLDNAADEAKRSIKEGGRLTTELAIPLMLKSQFNHIAHLEEQMVTKKELNGLKDQFDGLKNQVGFIKWMILFGFTLLAALQVFTTFIK